MKFCILNLNNHFILFIISDRVEGYYLQEEKKQKSRTKIVYVVEPGWTKTHVDTIICGVSFEIDASLNYCTISTTEKQQITDYQEEKITSLPELSINDISYQIVIDGSPDWFKKSM